MPTIARQRGVVTISEAARLQALEAYHVLDTEVEEAFDRLTALAAELFDVPIALVSLVDADRQWFKSRHGLDVECTPRSQAFCAHAIELEPGATMVVEDATTDPRFLANPLVMGQPNIRFYAGAVLTGAGGFNLGTLCLLDTKPRPAPSAKDLHRLQTLASVVVGELELRRLRASEVESARFERLANAVAGVGYWRLDVRTRTLKWSDQMFVTYGLDPGEAPGVEQSLAMIHPDDREVIQRSVAAAIETGQGWDTRLCRVIRPSGEIRYMEERGACQWEQGVLTAIVGTAVDVTDRTRAEMAAAEADADRRANVQLFENAFDHATIGMALVGMEGQFLKVNRAFCDLVGYPEAQLLDLDFKQITHADDLGTDLDLLDRLMAGRIPSYQMDKRYLRSDGVEVPVHLSVSMVSDSEGRPAHFVAQVQDLTASKAAASALAHSEQRFRRMADNAPDMIAESTPSGRLTYISSSCLAVTGFTAEELIGRNSASMMHPDDAAEVSAMCEAVLASKGALPPWPVQYRTRHKAGHEIWLEGRPTPAFDPVTGRCTGINDVVRDITERKAMEADLRQARVEAEAAAAVKSEFLANMSHELRTPLTSIVGFTGLAKEQADMGDLTRSYVDRVGEASRALLCTVNDILDFSKLEAGQVSFRPQPVSMARLGRATLDLFAPQAGAKDLELIFDAGPDGDDDRGAMVMVDPDRIRQVLLNLVGNAVKFTDAGRVTVTVGYDTDGQTLHVSVADTGAGIAPDKREALFKRFSQVDGSLTRVHGGTGLGLAICKGLIEAMGGRIGVDSTPGVGSRFWIAVPAQRIAAPADDAAEPAPARPVLSGVRVLVADDHVTNRELARLFLAGVGAEVTEAEDGETAAALAAALPFDVILMDMRMPRLDGLGALRRIRDRAGPNDATPIVAFTADADAATAIQLTTLGFQGIVAKPLDPGDLISQLARATEVITADGLALPVTRVGDG